MIAIENPIRINQDLISFFRVLIFYFSSRPWWEKVKHLCIVVKAHLEVLAPRQQIPNPGTHSNSALKSGSRPRQIRVLRILILPAGCSTLRGNRHPRESALRLSL